MVWGDGAGEMGLGRRGEKDERDRLKVTTSCGANFSQEGQGEIQSIFGSMKALSQSSDPEKK